MRDEINVKKTALIAVSDKQDLEPLVTSLSNQGWEILATGGTAKVITSLGVAVTQVAERTQVPEMLGGRVKTLHPKIHGGILFRRGNSSDVREIEQHDIQSIDLVVCNLYPFRETIGNADHTDDEALDQIDIGGPTMIRAAAKNYKDVLVVVDPTDYELVVEALEAGMDGLSNLPLTTRRSLASKAFSHVASYDGAISGYLAGADESFPGELTISGVLRSNLRYGENPHQRGALYRVEGITTSGLGGYQQHHGLSMSYVNVLDADAAFRCVSDFDTPAVTIVKHTNPCCAAVMNSEPSGEALSGLYEKALLGGDYVSAYGGIIAVNRIVDFDLASAIRDVRHPESGQRMLYDIIVAPGYEVDALEHLKKKSKNLRILEVEPTGNRATGLEIRTIEGGFLAQTPDAIEDITLDVVSEAGMEEETKRELRVAWILSKHVSSNAVVFVKDGVMVGMGAGQPNRVQSARLAALQAGEGAVGAVCATDAFLPFPDTLVVAAEAGCVAVVHTGGSIRDAESVEEANRRGIVLAVTGYRHFRH